MHHGIWRVTYFHTERHRRITINILHLTLTFCACVYFSPSLGRNLIEYKKKLKCAISYESRQCMRKFIIDCSNNVGVCMYVCACVLVCVCVCVCVCNCVSKILPFWDHLSGGDKFFKEHQEDEEDEVQYKSTSRKP